MAKISFVADKTFKNWWCYIKDLLTNKLFFKQILTWNFKIKL